MNGIQCRLGRVAVGWGIIQLAQAAKVSTHTIKRVERGEKLRAKTVDKIKLVLEEAGIEFLPDNGGGVGIRIKPPHKDVSNEPLSES
jgi:transcriptional regulator with XRE-family HTH domain